MFKVIPTHKGLRVKRTVYDITPEGECEAISQLFGILEASGCKVEMDVPLGLKGSELIDGIRIKLYRQGWWTHGSYRATGEYADNDLLTTLYHATLFKHEEPLSPTERV